MASRGFKYLEYLCDNPDEKGKVGIVHDMDKSLEEYHCDSLELSISDCYRTINLDFTFQSMDGYHQRKQKLQVLREGLDILEGRMEIQKSVRINQDLMKLLGGR